MDSVVTGQKSHRSSCPDLDQFGTHGANHWQISRLIGNPARMRTIAIYNPKGGVGKTSLAVNLAWCSSQLSRRRTLLWDMDVQGGAGFLLNVESDAAVRSKSLFEGKADILQAPIETPYVKLDIILADPSLGTLDRTLFDLGKKKRMARMIEGLHANYDRVIIDCPAGHGALADQIVRAADMVILPVAPSPLSQRVVQHSLRWFAAHAEKPLVLLPIFSMADPRKPLHRDALTSLPDWPTIPASNWIERMGVKRAPLGAFAPHSPAHQRIATLWRAMERKLAQ
jgi:chromosome partitioning protein